MPIPVSRTENVSSWSAAAPSRRRALTERTTSPRSVNLTAFESRFRSTWRRRVTSPTIAAGAPSPTRYARSRPFSAARVATRSSAPSTHSRRSNGWDSSSSFPASILEKSRMSLMTVRRASPLWRTTSANSRCSSVSGRVQEQPAHPDHRIQRRPDLVAHRRQEGALGLVGRLGFPAGPEELGDVVIDPDHAHLGAVDDHRHGRQLDVDQGAVLPGAPRDRADPLALERPPDVGVDLLAGLRGGHEVFHVATEGLRRRVPEEALRAGIPSHDLAVEVHGRDRHRARLHERLRVLLLALDLPEEAGVVDRRAPTGPRRSGGSATTSAENAPRSRRMITRPPSSRSSRTSGSASSERMPSWTRSARTWGATSCRSSSMSATWTGSRITPARPMAPSPSRSGAARRTSR